MRVVLEAAGVKDAVGKILGTTTKYQMYTLHLKHCTISDIAERKENINK